MGPWDKTDYSPPPGPPHLEEGRFRKEGVGGLLLEWELLALGSTLFRPWVTIASTALLCTLQS